MAVCMANIPNGKGKRTRMENQDVTCIHLLGAFIILKSSRAVCSPKVIDTLLNFKKENTSPESEAGQL